MSLNTVERLQTKVEALYRVHDMLTSMQNDLLVGSSFSFWKGVRKQII